MKFLYETKRMKGYLGCNFCGPEKLPHMQEVRIAVFKKVEGGDGQDVEIYCTATPDQLFVIKALQSVSSVGDEVKGFSLETGSGMLKWAVETAKAISEGMVAIDT